ncbi:hypothetical protein RJ641_024060 [Dillenia turbinata]|uniref:Uncharacterized protein n=1 Tax=Dillenia turbinata TaxID=194707 RepID=A0AAN8UKP0_9MAGN
MSVQVIAVPHGGEEAIKHQKSAKRRRFDKCFPFREISMEPGSLQDQDSSKLKTEIKRWAKAVVAYARQSPNSRVLVHLNEDAHARIRVFSYLKEEMGGRTLKKWKTKKAGTPCI